MLLAEEIVNWGIIGVGNVCEKKSGPAFAKVPHSRLVAVMRRDLSKAKDYASRHHVQKYYNNVSALLADNEVNAVYIATPPAYHEELALAGIRAGKPVYIEKPVTLKAEGCQRLIDVSSTLKIPVSVAHYRRMLPLFQKIKTVISNGEIGKVSLIQINLIQSSDKNLVADSEINWRMIPSISGGGIFHDLAPHQLDIIYWIFGTPISMRGHSMNQGSHSDTPNLTHFEAFFSDDIYLTGLWSFNACENSMEDRCDIFGETGKISFSFFRSPVLEIHSGKSKKSVEFPYPLHVQEPMINEVVRFFRGEAPNPCSLEDALVTMKMMDCTLNKLCISNGHD
jgi:1,5-anhydro-D-fructose reductase (1,5-anhydro-D-mannitol-forming)